ncbi:MAG: GntR family transcriptional regulator [Candidatus Thiodiazotropha sp.]
MSKPKYKLVENHIKKGIKKDAFSGKLPGERTLAKELGYSYMTIRKAIDNLVSEGLLYKVPTKGTFVVGKKEPRKQTHTIGYFLDDSIKGGISSPYYSLIFSALEKEAASKGYSLVYFSNSIQDDLYKTISKLDGVIASCFPHTESIIHDINNLAPVVAIDNSSADKSIPSVIIDNFTAVLDSFEHLISLGHRRIGFIQGIDDSDLGRNRYSAYRYGLCKHEIPYEKKYVYKGDFSIESGFKGAKHLLNQKSSPTAIICANDSMAIGAIHSIHQKGLNVPEDISVIGFDDIKLATHIYPSLTTIAVPIDEIIKKCVEMLIQLIENKDLDNRHIALPAKLVLRDSCKELSKHQAA